ncbi:MAG: class I SAM-dependent methyltransferase [Microcoleaceae cyanobacterium]
MSSIEISKTAVPKTAIPKTEQRSVEQIQEHYSLERRLAHRIKDSTKEQRQHLYSEVYDELFQKLPHHPQLTRKSSPEITAWIVTQRMQLLRHYLSPSVTYLEVGPGDCSLPIEVSKQVKKVYAVDVSTEIAKQITFPDNVEFAISDGCSIPVPDNSVDVAYSHQLMEHLHPDDALEQLRNLYRALAPGGIYICITPNRLSGPHDISRYFDEVATGFHLKEYTVTELSDLFRAVGFSKVTWVKDNGKMHLEIPVNSLTSPLIKSSEVALEQFPYKVRKQIANTPLLFRGMTIIGQKSC